VKLEEKFPKDYLQVLAHFYRGEINRATIWRQRMDSTTSWAILASTATFSYAFASSEVHAHFIFVFTELLVFLLLAVEARRYRYYDIWRTRVRMLEVHLLVPALNPELNILEGDWRTVLSNDLLMPTFKLSFWEAVGRRLYRNYIWIFALLLGGWGLKVYSGADIDGNRNQQVDFWEFYAACRYMFIPPPFTIFLQTAVNGVVLTILTSTWRRRTMTGEIRRKDPSAKKWPV